MTAMKCNINNNVQVIVYVFESNIYIYQNMLQSVGNKYFHIVFNNIKDCGTHNSRYFLPPSCRRYSVNIEYRLILHLSFQCLVFFWELLI